jgi:hypothetical protein
MKKYKKAKTIPTDNVGIKIIGALENPKYIARTISGIAKEIGIQQSEIIAKLISDNNLSSHVKIYPRKAKGGGILITTNEVFAKKAPALDKFIDIFSTKKLRSLNEIRAGYSFTER